MGYTGTLQAMPMSFWRAPRTTAQRGVRMLWFGLLISWAETASHEFKGCDPKSAVLAHSPQWEHEEGWWVGEYTLIGSDGNPSTSTSWNYPYDHYKGFITGNVQGNAYRQRNVFMYPPQSKSKCRFPNATGAADGSKPVGPGVCGINGNMKVFEADQTATKCSTNPELKGNIEGPYGSLQYTYTELVGKDNALLYQVFMTKAALNYYEGAVMGNPAGRCTGGPQAWECGYTEDRLMQSQLTTLTQLPDGSWQRTRTAQGFDAFGNVGATTYASYYRERKVSEKEFWAEFNTTLKEYSILDSDTCAWKSAETGGNIPSGLVGGFESCKAHLDRSFELTSSPIEPASTPKATPPTSPAAGPSVTSAPSLSEIHASAVQGALSPTPALLFLATFAAAAFALSL